MARTRKAKPGPGKEYWSGRYGHGGATPGRDTKKLTAKKERQADRRLVQKEKKEDV